MRYVDRSAVPSPKVLTDDKGKGNKELEKARQIKKDTPDKSLSNVFKAFKDDEVKDALHKLFLGKCAYCEIRYEGSQPVDVEHYRPKGEVTECSTHPGYWWLAMDWENLLPSCIDCNRERWQHTEGEEPNDPKRKSGKANYFPTLDNNWVEIEGSIDEERPVLLDPTRDDPDEYLSMDIENGIPVVIVKATDDDAIARAEGSIDIYGLNRSGLVIARQDQYDLISLTTEQIMKKLDEAQSTSDPVYMEAVELFRKVARFTHEDKPFTMMMNKVVSDIQKKLEVL